MKRMRYAVIIEKGEQSYGAYVPDLPGVTTNHKTRTANSERRTPNREPRTEPEHEPRRENPEG